MDTEGKRLENLPEPGNTEAMANYADSLESLDELLKTSLRQSGSVIERKPFSDYPEGFDFARATIAVQNLKSALRYFEERDIDISKIISYVDMGPSLALDEDHTLIVGLGSTEEEIKSLISGYLNPSTLSQEVEGTEQSAEEGIAEETKGEKIKKEVLSQHGVASFDEISPLDREAIALEITRRVIDEALPAEHERYLTKRIEEREAKGTAEKFKEYFEQSKNWLEGNSRALRISLAVGLVALIGGRTIENQLTEKSESSRVYAEKAEDKVEDSEDKKEEVIEKSVLIEAKEGDTVWEFAEKEAAKAPGFSALDDAQKTWVLAPEVDRIMGDSEAHGISKDGLRVGDRIDTSKLVIQKNLADRIVRAVNLSIAQKESIRKNNSKIKKWLAEHPNEKLDETKVGEILKEEPEPNPEVPAPEVQTPQPPRSDLHEQIAEAKSKPEDKVPSKNLVSNSDTSEKLPIKRTMASDMENSKDSPELREAFANGINEIYGKGRWFKNGVNTPEWKLLRSLPAKKIVSFATHDSTESDLPPNIRNELTNKASHQEMLRHITLDLLPEANRILSSVGGAEASFHPFDNEPVEGFVKRLSSFIWNHQRSSA